MITWSVNDIIKIAFFNFFFDIFFFFFQAEDGIRDIGVTGVQTCALPIFCKSLLLKSNKEKRTASPNLLTTKESLRLARDQAALVRT